VQCFVTAWEQWLWTSEGGSGSSGISPPTFPMAEADAPASLLEFVRVNPEYVNDVGFGTGANDDLVIHFATVRADSKILTNAFYPSPELRAFHATWEAIVDVINANAPASAGPAFQVCGTDVGARNTWIYMVRQETYIQIAVQGVVAGLGIGFFVILISTQNFIVAGIALVTISFIIISVLGTMGFLGWQLGDIESICLMILAGFAIDYVVHLAHAFMESESPGRVERVADALADLGISVFWGMATSLFASIGLVLCLLQFFARFGTFLLMTILFAYFWAAVFMMALLAFVGPQRADKTGGEAKSAPITPAQA